MNSADKHMNIYQEATIKNKKRGDILSYSISQVAALLGEEDRNILYYTNVFDNILKIEILDKELRYTNRDVDKLEFLINLKNKGMTIKEIQNYCKELPLNIEDLAAVNENSSVSVKEIISTIIESENKNIDNLKECLVNKIRENNELSVEKIVEGIVQEQNKQIKLIRNDILTEIKEYIDYKFDIEYRTNKDLYNKFSIKIDELTSEKNTLEDTIKLQIKEYNEISISRDNNLINEIRRFKNVIEQAYYVQNEIETQTEKISFIERLFGAIHLR